MQSKALILKIVEAYHDARLSKAPNKRVRRGRSHSISSITEDLIAGYLVSNDKTIDTIYVDQPLSIRSKKKQIYPDLIIVRKGVIQAFIDVKMDLGWNRNGFFDLCSLHREIAKSVRGTECVIKDGITKQPVPLKISPTLSYNIIVISRTNISPRVLDEHIQKVSALQPDVDVFVLCDKNHPNAYGMEPKEIVKGLAVNESEFKRLLKKVAQ